MKPLRSELDAATPNGTEYFAIDVAGAKHVLRKNDGTWEAIGFPDGTPALQSIEGCRPVSGLHETVRIAEIEG